MSAVEVWLVGVSAAGADLERWLRVLEPAERRRADGYRNPADRQRFIVSRAFLRSRLGARLGCSATAIRFRRDEHGKPRLATGPVRFSVAHSGDLAAIALCETAEVGIDVEAWRPGPECPVAERVCAPEEWGRVVAAPHPGRAFTDHWVRKEAVLKARGTGLGGAPREVVVTPGTTEALGDIVVQDLDARHGYSAALAVAGGTAAEPRVVRHLFPA